MNKPFIFFTSVWGERFCDYMTEFCVPSLLSPGNIPALDSKNNNKFVISCPPEDRAKMEKSNSIIELQKYIEIIWHELNVVEVESEKYRYMSMGYKYSTEVAYQLKGYGMCVNPDTIYSDDMVKNLKVHASHDVKVVFAAALRFGTEPLFKELTKLGHNMDLSDVKNSKGRTKFCVSPRDLASVAIKSMHTEALCYEWEVPYFTKMPSACWWRVDDGSIIVHSLSWGAVMIDYSELDSHDTDVFDTWTIDGDYIYKNFGDRSDFYIVQDSDEMISVSWASMEEGSWCTRPDWKLQIPILGRLIKGIRFNYAFNSEFFDPIKRKAFALPVIWHGNETTDVWKRREDKIRKLLLFYIPPEQLGLDAKSGILARFRYKVVVSYYPVYFQICEQLRILKYRSSIIFNALSGDKSARDRIIRVVKSKLIRNGS